MGAIQAQDYSAAKWALGQRMDGANDAVIENAFTTGTILRTHVMRPTWHFVTPQDIRWMLALTAPRIIAQCATAYRYFGLDVATFRKCNKALEKALHGGRQLMREEIAAALQKANVNTDGLRFTHLLMRAELDGIICSGGRNGKQFTYALLEERVPQSKTLKRNEALAELTMRYFNSHGPATLHDFAWWSGLNISLAKEGMEMVKSLFVKEEIEGKTYWLSNSMPSTKKIPSKAYLLPNYDEYVVSYKDRNALIDPQHIKKLDSRENALFTNVIILNGRIEGIWKRTVKKNDTIIETKPFSVLNTSQANAVARAVKSYKKFHHTTQDL